MCLPTSSTYPSSCLWLQVLHGGANDVTWLQRDYGIYLINVVDTEKMAVALGPHAPRGLGQLLALHCGIQQVRIIGANDSTENKK